MNEWEYRVRIFRWGMVVPCSDMQTAGHLPLVMTTKDDTTDWKTFVCKKKFNHAYDWFSASFKNTRQS